MKKYTNIAYISLILIVFLSGLFIYKVFGKSNLNEKLEEKALAEIKYLESKFQNLFNELNNISFENYKISSSEIKEENKSETSEESKGSSSSEEKNSKKEESSSSKLLEENSKDNKQYKLEKNGILNKDSEINWNQIKDDIEKTYTVLYPTTIDLYQTTINQQEIINFNKEYDNLTKAVKEESKENSLKELSILYDYLTKFMEKCTSSEKEKIIIKTKNNVFRAYSILDKEEWSTISENINNATQEFTKLVTDVSNEESRNQYNINKTYIIINELQNAITLKDKDVFLIKYKNLLEELQNV